MERNGGFDQTLEMGIDYDLWLRLSAHWQFDFVPQSTVRYRIWAGQMSKNYRKRYESAIRIMRSFLANNPGVVNRNVVRAAWAHTYAGRADTTLWQERDHLAAFKDYRRALSFAPWSWSVWRSILRSLLTTRAPS
jgi:tetratricopeptide (TPR) repeat protein